jgi:hypothetical protein
LIQTILGIFDSMPNCPGVVVDFPIVTTRVSFVAKEVNGLVFDARDFFFSLNMVQAVSLVPASREDIEGNLTSNRVAVTKLYVRAKVALKVCGL